MRYRPFPSITKAPVERVASLACATPMIRDPCTVTVECGRNDPAATSTTVTSRMTTVLGGSGRGACRCAPHPTKAKTPSVVNNRAMDLK